MAHTANFLTEHLDSPALTAKNIKKLKQLLTESKHCIVFTGAGVSTSAKIPDFRGPTGVWTREAQGLDAPKSVSLDDAQPTVCHEVISALVKQGIVKHIVSQNIDGLHRRSGVPRGNISELHGNCFLELCWKCGFDKEHLTEVCSHVSRTSSRRDGKCKECLQRVSYYCHCTGNKCPQCQAKLKDSIIHFEEDLPIADVNMAFDQARKADLCVVFGSSLSVTPACNIPKTVAKRGGKLVIINMQSTGMDHLASLRMFAKTDVVCEGLKSLLQSDVPAMPTPSSPRFHIPPFSVHVGNTHELIPSTDGNKHQCKLFAKCDLENAKYIQSMEFHVHPTFKPRIVQVTEPVVLTVRRTACYEVDNLLWDAPFKVQVVVNFTNGTKEMIEHDLSFSSTRTQGTHTVQQERKRGRQEA